MDVISAPRYRPVTFGNTLVSVRETAGGIQHVVAQQELQPYPRTMTERLLHWARVRPDQVFLAQRLRNPDGSRGAWRHLTWGSALASARSICQALLDRGLSNERPIAILSENDIEHALLALGCMLAGVPYCPVSPAYATVSRDYGKLRHVLDTLTPGLVFASDADRFGPAILATVPQATEVVLTDGAIQGRSHTAFSALLRELATSAVDTAMEQTGPDTVVKLLFTSGSTKLPKAVINTQRMWTANQQQLLQCLPLLGEEPPVLVDWLPWNHTFGGNQNFGIVIYNGGSMYIDEGKPVAALVGETLRNLREVAPTIYFNVPTGFEALAQAMRTDAELRRNLLSRVRLFFYAGAGLAQPVWDMLRQVQEQEVGERIVMATGLGMTESGPSALFVTSADVSSGHLGVPSPGLEVKLVPVDGKNEIRYRGPNISPGYWRNREATAASRDEEGFLCTGDAVRWIDPANPHRGLRFDGRIAEDFKLATGTFVSVGPLRARIISAGAPYVQDAVITGIDRTEIGALLFPTAAVRALAGAGEEVAMEQVLRHPNVVDHFQKMVDGLAAQATGSATRVARVHLLSVPPSIDLGEVTDKGSINQRAVLTHRDAIVQSLHEGTIPVIICATGS